MIGKSSWILAAALMSVICGSQAWAGPIYSFAFDQVNYDVAPGGTVDVKVFLIEDVSSGGSSLLNSFGLLGAGVLVRTEAPLPSQPALVMTTADIIANAPPPNGAGGPFDGLVSLILTSDSAGLTESVDITSPPVFAAGPGPVYQIYLGTFRYTAGLVAGEVTHLSAERTASDSLDNVVADSPPNAMPTVLDDLIQPSTATITVSSVSAVPEPGSVVLMLAASLTLVAGRRWRRPRGPR